MKALYNQQKKWISSCRKWRGVPFLVLIISFVQISASFAQSTNLSDWHVPPPLSPGNTAKGDATGKNAKSSPVTLILVDIPAPQLPKGPPIQLPRQASISAIAPAVNAPEQPVAAGTTAVPSPATPDAPAMPQLQLQDEQAAIDMPNPAAPELPPVPAEPLPSKTMNINTRFPIMPAMIDQVSVVFPTDATQNYFPMPLMPENNRENINMPPATENDKQRVKPKKTKPTENKPNRQR
ncbi:MAG: hypothetical protein V4577_29280 [Bacteroidota bacterium]